MAHTVRQLEAETTPLKPGPEARRHPCEEVSTDDEFSLGENIPGFNSMDIESHEDMKRSLRNGHAEQRRLAKKCKQEGGGR